MSTLEQQTIITSRLQNLCVLASAGSGKTFVIVERVAHLITTGQLKPSEIAVITFTNLAADELAKRLGIRLSEAGIDEPVYTGTIHSFCIKLLKDFDPPLAMKLKVLTAGKQFALLYRKFRDWNLQACCESETRKSELISRLARTFDYINLSQSDHNALKLYAQPVYSAFEQYQTWCTENFYLDFSTILSRFVEKLDDLTFHDFVVSKIRHLIVDEYQDTDQVQESIVTRLSNSVPIMVVGDDDQCIYQFRGTTPENIVKFVDRIRDASEKPLSTNFRCGANIVRLADAIVSRIVDRKPKILIGDWAGGSISVAPFADTTSEAAHIAATVERLKKSGAVKSFSEVALLFRSVASHSVAYISALRSRNIPVIVRGDRGLFEQPEMTAFIGLFEVLISTETTLDRISHLSAAIGVQITIPGDWTGPEHFDEFGPEEWYQLSLDDYATDIIDSILRLRQKYLEQKFSSFLELVLDAGTILEIIDEERSENIQRNFGRLTQIAGEYDEIVGGKNLTYFIIYLKIFASKNFDAADVVLEGEEAVSVLTVHQSKGLEFEAVFLPMLVDKRFPLEDNNQPILLDSKNFDLSAFGTTQADERRIFYVAITRARSQLFLSAPRDVGLIKPKTPSVFYQESTPFTIKDTGARAREIKSKTTRKDLSLSYSTIEYYLSCPYRYKLLFDIGIATPQNPFFAFGQLIHLVLRVAHVSFSVGTPITEADLLAFYDANFPNIYSVPKITLESMRRRGRIAIARYLSEKSKWLKKTWQTELPFVYSKHLTCRVGDVDLELNGQIDLLVGDETHYEIIDFKTGKPHAYIQTELQLQLYAYALAEHFGKPPFKATVYYVEENKEISYQVTSDWIFLGQQLLTKAASGISNREFSATPGQVCTRCEVAKLCQFKQT